MRGASQPAGILFAKLAHDFVAFFLGGVQGSEVGSIEHIAFFRRAALDGQHDVHGLLAFDIRGEADGRAIEAVAEFAAVDAYGHSASTLDFEGVRRNVQVIDAGSGSGGEVEAVAAGIGDFHFEFIGSVRNRNIGQGGHHDRRDVRSANGFDTEVVDVVRLGVVPDIEAEFLEVAVNAVGVRVGIVEFIELVAELNGDRPSVQRIGVEGVAHVEPLAGRDGVGDRILVGAVHDREVNFILIAVQGVFALTSVGAEGQLRNAVTRDFNAAAHLEVEVVIEFVGDVDFGMQRSAAALDLHALVAVFFDDFGEVMQPGWIDSVDHAEGRFFKVAVVESNAGVIITLDIEIGNYR